MPDILKIGPLMIRMDWLMLLLSGAAGFAAMHWKWKRSAFRDRPVLDPLLNAVLIVLVVWKISPVFTSPSLLTKNPLLWLTVPGNTVGWWIGSLAALAYLYRAWKKTGAPRRLAVDLAALGIVAAISVHSLLGWQYGTPTALPWGISIENPDFKYHPVNVYRLLVTLPMFVWLWRNDRLLGTGKWMSNTLTYCGMGLMAVSFFQTKSVLVFGLSAEQTVYLSAMVAGIAGSFKLDR